MKRTIVLVFVMLVSVTLMGCGTDPIENTVSDVLSQAQEATSKLNSVRTELRKVADKAEKKKTKISMDDLKTAFEKADELTKVGQKLNTSRAAVDNYRGQIDDKKKEELKQMFSSRLAQSQKAVEKAMDELNKTVARVKTLVDNQKTTGEALKNRLGNATSEFAALTRRR